MKVAAVEITDTLGIEHAQFKLGSITRFEGANGVGKSSLLRALNYVGAGGTDPGMIRSWRCTGQAHDLAWDGGRKVEPGTWSENESCTACAGRGRIEAEKSVIRIEVDNGDVLQKVTRLKRGGKSYTTEVTVTQADGEPRPAPQAYINELLGSLIDPSVLLRIDTTTAVGKQKLAAELTQLVAISFTRQEIKEAFCKRPGALPPAAMLAPETTEAWFNGHPIDGKEILTLDGLKRISVALTDTRRRVGVTRDDTSGTVKRLQAALPDGDGKDYSAALASLEEKRFEIEKQVADERVRIEKERATFEAAATDIWQKSVEATNAKIDKQIVELNKERTRLNDAHASDRDIAKTQARDAEKASLEAMEAEAKPFRDQVAGDLARIQAMQEASIKAKTLREEMEMHRNVSRQAAIEYDRWSEVLKNLESLRLDKLKELPVQGLIVEDGEVFLDGIPWDKVNLQRRVFAVVQIATLRAGKVAILTIDDAEHLDEENRRELEEGLVEAGFQLLIAHVSEGPLTIKAAP